MNASLRSKRFLKSLLFAAVISILGLIIPFILKFTFGSSGELHDWIGEVHKLATLISFVYLYFGSYYDAWKRLRGTTRIIAFLFMFVVPVLGTYLYFWAIPFWDLMKAEDEV